MVPRMAVLLIVSALAMSGCVGNGADPGQGPDTEGDPDGAGGAAVDAPEWSIGDHWSYETPDGEFTLVVTGEQDGDWITGTTGTPLALFEAMFDVSYVGPIAKSDLSGDQGGTPVKFFDFPLEDGKEWTTTWDGASLTITATREDDGVYRMQGMDGSRLHVEYVYDAEVRFFEEATWFGGNDGQDWGMKRTGSGDSFRGTLHEYTIGDTHNFVHEADGTGLYEVDLDGEWNELAFTSLLICLDDPAGQIHVGVDGPQAAEDPLPMFPTLNDPERGDSLDCAKTKTAGDNWTMENPGGTWEIGFIVGSPNGIAHLFVTERRHDEIAFPE